MFIENATSIEFVRRDIVPVGTPTPLQSYFLAGIKDLAGNNLRSNRVNLETEFTVLMPQGRLDFGDAPDPSNTTLGRYPTLIFSNGARHPVIGADEIQIVGWTGPDQAGGSFTLSFGGENDFKHSCDRNRRQCTSTTRSVDFDWDRERCRYRSGPAGWQFKIAASASDSPAHWQLAT